MRYAVHFATAGLVAAAAITLGIGASDAPTATAAPKKEPSVYRPVTSDLMNDVIQPRHIKLWLAGKNQNWEFAEYERHNIGGAFARMAAAIPNYKGMSTADLVSSFITPALADLEKAIKAKNEAAFVEAYNGLTTGCNSCHQATQHEIAVIKVPDSNPFVDQDFGPGGH